MSQAARPGFREPPKSEEAPKAQPAAAGSPQEPPQARPSEPQPSEQPLGWVGRARQRAADLRETAAGGRRPLGSPEGRVPLLQERPKRSTPVSIDRRAVVDGLAASIRAITSTIDSFVGERLGRDFTATAAECYEIAGPLASYAIERYDGAEVASVAGTVLERPGLVGGAMRAGAYGARVWRHRPGGRAEEEMIRERAADRMAEARAKQEAQPRRATSSSSSEGDAWGEMAGLG